MEKNGTFFYKERKRAQRTERSFEKNGCPLPNPASLWGTSLILHSPPAADVGVCHVKSNLCLHLFSPAFYSILGGGRRGDGYLRALGSEEKGMELGNANGILSILLSCGWRIDKMCRWSTVNEEGKVWVEWRRQREWERKRGECEERRKKDWLRMWMKQVQRLDERRREEEIK